MEKDSELVAMIWILFQEYLKKNPTTLFPRITLFNDGSGRMAYASYETPIAGWSTLTDGITAMKKAVNESPKQNVAKFHKGLREEP